MCGDCIPFSGGSGGRLIVDGCYRRTHRIGTISALRLGVYDAVYKGVIGYYSVKLDMIRYMGCDIICLGIICT